MHKGSFFFFFFFFGFLLLLCSDTVFMSFLILSYPHTVPNLFAHIYHCAVLVFGYTELFIMSDLS